MENPRRDRILEQTRKEFLEFGYSGFTMDDISARTGVSKATIYKYFPAKHDLVKKLVEDYLEEEKAKQQKILNSGKGFIESMVDTLSLVRERMCFFQRHVLKDLEKNAPDILELIHRSRDENMPEHTSILLKRGQKEKKVNTSFDPDLVAFVMLTLARELSSSKIMEKFNLDFKDLHQFLINLTLGGILTDNGKKELNDMLGSRGKSDPLPLVPGAD